MHARRIIYIVIGSILVLLNLAIDIAGPVLSNKNAAYDTPSRIGYFIGSQFFILIAVVLFALAFTVTKKINRKTLSSLQRNIDEIGRT